MSSNLTVSTKTAAQANPKTSIYVQISTRYARYFWEMLVCWRLKPYISIRHSLAGKMAGFMEIEG